MKIQDMFVDDINRRINGVIQVEQEDKSTEQELNEYVITRELKRHFMTFFNTYDDAFDTPTTDIGVWISGFFGSGKSHFMKMLSYILENKTINDIPTVERFRKKFADDPATFMLIDRAAKAPTETILFNIDVEGPSDKDKTAVLKVFAKMFYKHLGFCDTNLKVAKLEQFIEKQGKTAAFRRVFEEKNGAPWVETRDDAGFFEDDVVETLEEVLGMSEASARDWFNGKETVDISIAQLVSEIKAYVQSKPKNFRLLFMVDEVGQYVGTDTNLLLNLQSLVEKVGSECGGKVWIVCTGQEAIDEIIKVRMNEFSRIQARFKMRLSLSSSAVDEVIQKRLLTKRPEAKKLLTDLYGHNDSVLKNLFTFTDSVLDIKGYGGPEEFVVNYPFVPYQFILIQKIFSEIRKHGAAGKHYSGAERSMLDGFQIVAKSIEDRDEHALAPLYPFYDSIHSFLDGSIRRVIERCQRAAENHDGIETYDVNVLKLLYLIRYIDDVKSNLDNIVILMADDIRTDKIALKQKVQESLDRLKSQNYIDRRGDTYIFLTDEEQDIAREIANTSVDTAQIIERIGQVIFGDIYTQKKYRFGKYDFSFDKMVDSTLMGTATGGMILQFLTVAADDEDKQEFHLLTDSKGKSAIVVLADTPYYESLENAMKIRTYVKQRNINQLPKSVQDIIRDQQDEAGKYEASAKEELEKAIMGAVFYADGEHIPIANGTAVSMIGQALQYLVEHIYSELGLITKHVDTDADIIEILQGTNQSFAGMEDNRDAAAKVDEYLEMQSMKKLPTSMDDIQTRYQKIPYGWKEIDIAAVVALLIHQQKVTIKYGGATIRPDNPKLPDMLRKKSERGKALISIKQSASAQQMRAAKDIMREYFDIMDVPDDEDSLVMLIIDRFQQQKEHYEGLNRKYEGHKYPNRNKVTDAIQLMDDVLSQKKDNIALINRLVADEDKLFDSKDDLQPVEAFFKNQVTIFDAAVKMEADLHNDLPYIQRDEATNNALNQIRKITLVKENNANIYQEIPKLNELMDTVRTGHNQMLEEKRTELLEIVRQCLADIHQAAGEGEYKQIVEKADNYFTQKKQQIAAIQNITLLDGLKVQMWDYKDNALDAIEKAKKPNKPMTPAKADQGKKHIKNYYRQSIFKPVTLESQAEVDAYVEKIHTYLSALLKDCDGIKLN